MLMIGAMAFYIEVQIGPSPRRRGFVFIVLVLAAVSFLASLRASGALLAPSGRRLWRSGPLGRAWLTVKRGRGL